MIISVSERTDIPAFYSDWFYRRLEEGFVDVVNPFNEKQISRLSLLREDVDAFVFVSKNPTPMFDKLDLLDGYPCLFEITITPYDKKIEKHVNNKQNVIESIKYLSKRYGKNAVILRYDPIFLNDFYTIEEHRKAFNYLLKSSHPYIDTCSFSFLNMYKNTLKNKEILNVKTLTKKDVESICRMLVEEANQYNIQIQCCASQYGDLSEYGVKQDGCMSNKVFSKLLGYEVNYKKDTKKRDHCSCVSHRDIGFYNSCPHFCGYCYANYDEDSILSNIKKHHKESSLLIGQLDDETLNKIKDKEKKEKQLSLF